MTILKINQQLTEDHAIQLLKMFPEVNRIKEVDVEWAGSWLRKVFENQGKIDKRELKKTKSK